MATIKSRRTNHPFIIGLFVIIGTLALLFALIFIGSSSFFKSQETYVTYFESSVEGLEVGSPVKYQGVNVGQISAIEIAPDNKLIQVVMELSDKIKVSDSLRIKAEFAGLAGNKFLQLYYPDNQDVAATFPVLNFDPPYPVIQSAPSGIDEITIAARDVVNKIRDIDFARINIQTLEFLNNANRFVGNKDLYDIVNNVEASSIRLNNLIQNAINSGAIENVGDAAQSINVAARDLRQFTNSLNVTLDEMDLPGTIDFAVAKYDTAMTNFGNIINNSGSQVDNLIYSMNRTIEDLRASNQDLRRALRTISDNPSSIFLVNPPPVEK